MRPEAVNASVRRPAVAGMFYPADADELRAAVAQYLMPASRDHLQLGPKALIVPHAGYIYSGTVAGAGYAAIAARRDIIRRVVLLGPSHRVYLRGLAVPRVDSFETPLGTIEIDDELRSRVVDCGRAILADGPHAQEHSLEVQLPFLQVLLRQFTLLPLVAGVAGPEEVAAALDSVWGDEETAVLVSSDLSHYHPYAIAQQIDRDTSAIIRRMQPTLTGEQACGAVCINGLLHLAAGRDLRLTEITRLNSGDTAGDRDRVVGYGAFVVHEPAHT